MAVVIQAQRAQALGAPCWGLQSLSSDLHGSSIQRLETSPGRRFSVAHTSRIQRTFTAVQAIAAPDLNQKQKYDDFSIAREKAPGRLMRLRTVQEDFSEQRRGGLPSVGRWEETSTATWQRHMLYPWSFYDRWMVCITRSSDSMFGKGKGPFSNMMNDPSKLGPYLRRDFGAAGRELMAPDGGLSLGLAFLSSFPSSMESCKMIGNLWLPTYVLDDWLEQQSMEEVELFNEWLKGFWHMSESGDYSQGVALIQPGFVADPKRHKYALLYCNTVQEYHKKLVKVHPFWPRRYSWAMYVWAMGTIEENKAFRAFQATGKLPSLLHYLSYRPLSSGALPCTVLALAEVGLRPSVASFQRAIPLMLCTATIGAMMNDIMPAGKDPSSNLLNVVSIVGQERAVQVHNILVDLFCEEIERFLVDAAPGDEELVDVCRGTVFGDFMWMNTCERYRPFVEKTKQPVALADCQEGRLTDKRNPLYGEIKGVIESIFRRVPGECPV